MSTSSGALVEPLTRREQTILIHLVAHKSNQEIAVLETLSPNSVKWYVHQIFAKMGVNRRAEVAGRAQELGLLPQAATLDSAPPKAKNNLPAQMTSFIGREREINELVIQLKKKATRLLTLTGSGGTGKTRLALQVAGDLLEAFPDGVRLVELAPLADPALVPQAVISALGLVEQPGKTPMTFLEDYLQSKHLLLILDNCEHLVAACAELSSTLLKNAPRLVILATSREILGVDGEIPFRVPPLGMPDSNHLPLLEGLSCFDAVRLFVERAQVVSPGFTLTADNAAGVVQITQRLDGIPLALELAAARLRLLSVNQIALRLDDAFRLLTGGSRTALPRHQTLQALIDWSYNLLTESERTLLRSLSVFAGGWMLGAAEEVCTTETVAAHDILDLLGQLADKSLILTVPGSDGKMRFHMLETVRQYAHARLVASGEAEAARQSHLDYYLHLAETLEPKIRSREQVQIQDYWWSELDNLRLALEWSLKANVKAGLRLAVSLDWFWGLRISENEGPYWLERLIDAEALNRGSLPLSGSLEIICAWAFTVLGGQFIRTGLDLTKANHYLAQAMAIYRTKGPEHWHGLAWTLVWQGRCKTYEGDLVQTQVLSEEALSLFRQNGDALGIAECLQNLGSCEIEPAKKKSIYEEMLAVDEAQGDTAGIATALMLIAWSYIADGDYESANSALETSRELYWQVGDRVEVHFIEAWLSLSSLLNGDYERASFQLEKALAIFRDLAAESYFAACLFLKGMLAFAQGSYDQVVEVIKEAECIAQKTDDVYNIFHIFYLRARLARLHGDTNAARQYAEEGLKTRRDLGADKIHLLLELGYLALQDGDLARAGSLVREGLRVLIQWREMIDMNRVLDGLAVLAVREGKHERAARLFGTRLWRGWSHALSPIECASREADFAALTTALGEARFAKLREEGLAMPFMQVLALAQEEG